ncbi:MAG TPA: carboxypeptidase regulatory-like domain-containing protein [Gaiellaceae bacterium]|nr:carboxypeptidase regulatory-like domain-containing protein [Gaiellaceae bacterium]
MRHGVGRGRKLVEHVLKTFTKRWVAVAAVLVAAAVATVVAASATTHTSPAELSLARTGSPQASMAGGQTRASSFKHRVAVKGHLPKAVKHSHPRELHLKAAHGKVFDVRKLKSTVVKKERPERTAPGYARPGSRAAEALENPPRTAPQLPKVIKKSQMVTRQAALAPDSSFDGLDFANWGQGHPPDTNGDVGPNYYIQTINVSIGIYQKTTGSRVAAFTFNSFMSQGHFGNLCDTDNFGDPVVIYDSYEDRWIITDFAFKLDGSGNVNPQHAFQCFAVSKTGDPVNGGWNFYSIEAPGGLNDYPKFGIWPDGLYMSANMFGYAAGASFSGFHMWALNKQQMYNGDPSPQVVDFAGDTSDFTVIPANSRLQTGTPPAGSPEYFVSTEQFLNALSIYKFHVDWDKVSTSTFTGPSTQLAPNCWPNATPANASTTANAADVLAIRAMAQAQYSNLAGAESLWVTHTVQRNVSATNTNCNAITGGNASVRWYQANVTGGTVAANTVQGATFDPEAANTFFRFMPAAAVNRNGDLAIGYTKSNSVTNPQLKYTGRLAGDPVNTLTQGESTLIDGTGAQSGNCGPSTCIRWGDYSGMALDPNGCTFWETGEYFATTGLNHQTRIGSFHFPGCTNVGNGTLSGTVTDGSSPISGATIALGSRTTTTNGSGQYSFSVPAGTYPSLTASKPGFNPAAAATIAVPDGGTATRNLTLSASAQSGCFNDNSQSTFQRGVPANCDLVSSPGSVQLANPDNTAAQNTNVNPSGFSFTNTSWAGQTFTPTVTGQIKRVDVELFCLCSVTSPNVTLSIRNTTGATPIPTGADLGTATLAGFNDGGAGGLKTFTFASPITVTAGTRYAFVFRLNAAPAAGNTVAYTCSCAGTGTVDFNPYASGQRVTSTTSGASWAADATAGGRDLNFVTYINPGFASSGTFTSSLKDANPAAGRTPTWTTFTYSATTPAGTAVKFQMAASNNAAGPFNFVGPDGTASTFFTTSGASLSQFNGFRYLKYKAFLSTTNSAVTPSVSSVQVCFNDAAATQATTLAVDPAIGTSGGTADLSAHLTSAGVDVPNETVAFSLNGIPVGTALTDSAGVARKSGASLAGIPAGSYPNGVTASFAGDASFDPSSGSASLTVYASQTITFPAISNFTWNGGSASLNASASSGLAVSYSVLSGPCSITGSTLTATHAGSCVVAADQAGNATYSAAPQVTRSATVDKASQTITVTTHAPASAVFNDSFGVGASGGGSGNPVTFSSAGACSNTGSSFTMTSGTGTCSVKYDQAGDGDYVAAPQVVETTNAQKASQVINVTQHAPASAVFNTSFSVAATGGGSGNPVTFSSSGSCSTTGATFTITSGTGTCSVKYDQAGDANYNAAPQVTETVNAQKAAQSINVTTHAPATAGFNETFDVAANAPGGAVTFSSAGSCSNTGHTFTITSGTGTCSVKYDQAGNANYNAAPQVTETVTVGKSNQSIIVTLHAPASRVFGDSFSVAASGGGSGNPVTFSSSGACSNVGDTFTITSGTGTCTVKYDQAGNGDYNPAPQVVETTTAQKASQAINVTTHAPASAVFNTSFSVAASGGGSGNAVTFSSGGACSNTGASFTMTSGTGTCSVNYDQAGDSNYNAASQVVETTNAQKANQTVNVTTHAPASAAYNSSFGVAATAPGGAVTFTSSGSCSNTGANYTITSGNGTCSVKYDQAGNGNYNAAPQVVETTNAQKANQAIVVTLHAPASAVFGSSFSVAASGGDSGNAVTFSSAGVCSNTGDTFTMTSGTGTCTVKYDKAGDTNYNAAPQVTETTTAQKAAQSITFAPLPDRTYGDPDFTVSATASSGLAVSFGASGQCTVTGATVHLTGPGSCTITASQGGDSNYAAATDVSRTFQISAPAQSVAQFADEDATCAQFAGGAAPVLSTVDYTDKSGLIKKAVPNMAVYWVKVHLSAGARTIEIDQAITSGNFSQKLTLASGGKVFTAACGKVKQPTFTSGPDGSVTVGLNAAATGDYLIAVRYHTSAVNGQPTPAPTTIHYLFTTAGVSGSSATLDLLRQAAARSASPLRTSAFLRLLRR